MAEHKKKIKINSDGSVHIETQHFDSGGTVVPYGANPLTDVSNALTVQNGYNAATPNISTQEGNYNAANAGQNQLTQALQNQANGEGPNPANAELNQATNANANQAAGLVASQRGLNPGEAARIGANAGVNANQQAAGQAATTNAQQQLAAEQGLESVYGQQENAASQNASVINQGTLGAEGLNAGIAQNNTNSVNKTQGGLTNGLGGVLSGLFAKGGKVENPKLKTVARSDRFKGNLMPSHLKAVDDIYHSQHFDWGGSVQPGPLANVSIPSLPGISADDSTKGKSGGSSRGTPLDSPDSATEANNFGADELTMPELGSSAGLADAVPAAALLSKGGKVGGKPKVGHDAYSNDTVDAKLTPGEVVIDIDTLHDKGPMGDAARMLARHIESKKKENGGDHEDDFKEALGRAVAGRKGK